MAARYLIRFDDICPTMNWPIWRRVENLLVRYEVTPILAVVPDNRDPKLMVQARNGEFWDRVRSWQERGWTIGWHGYQHLYSSHSSGVVGIHDGSEFAELPEEVQRAKLVAAAAIFLDQRVSPKVWIAPGHSFDATTVRLLAEFGVSVISDGFYWHPVERDNCIWLPQQLWRFRSFPLGMWTVCLHINSWKEDELFAFEEDLQRFSAAITSVDSVLECPTRRLTFVDRVFDATYRTAVRFNTRARRRANH
jgi:predicted deacetylase